MLNDRQSGILLHPSSLSGPQGVGSLGAEAYRFVDFLAESGQSLWQLLPLGPTGYGNCPYSAFSAFAGNPLLISLEQLVADGDLHPEELGSPLPATERVDFGTVQERQLPLLRKAAERFLQQATAERREAFESFCREQAFWLNDYAFFQAMRAAQNHAGWLDWPQPVRQRQEQALRHWGERLSGEIDWHKYLQFVFCSQWFHLKEYANARGIRIFGDLPIFVAFDSADVWANRQLFHLDDRDRPTQVAGVPPDYFSKTGQRWGNPLYRWERMAQQNYSWWLARFRWNLQLFDLVRVDHFRGFEAHWAIPAAEPTAVNGSWQPGPGAAFFEALQRELGSLPIIAEDLGVITPAVEDLRDRFELPGMKVLQFAFDSGPDNPYLPHNHPQNAVVYTGTHDNNTSLGWWRGLTASGREQVHNYLGQNCRDMPWTLIRTALASTARLAVIPMQDLLSLDGKARMNRPGIGKGNWEWRLEPEALTGELSDKLAGLTHLYGRSPSD